MHQGMKLISYLILENANSFMHVVRLHIVMDYFYLYHGVVIDFFNCLFGIRYDIYIYICGYLKEK